MNNIKNKTAMRFMSIAFIISLLWSQTLWALPQDGTVVGGSSTISQPNATTMQINQTTDKSIINWQGYSIGANESVRYNQPNSGSISVNRVVGQDPSLIYGQLSANGQVWVINPNGLLVGNGASINVGSFLGSTLNINDNDFMNGNYKFINTTGSLSSITNQGNINAADGGYVAFISPTINNSGNITANNGSVNMASGDDVTLTFANNGLINLVINKQTAEQALGIDNSGTIIADGGQVILSAKVAGDILKTVINNEGIIQARTIENRSGKIYLLGGMENNAINVGGTLDASAPNIPSPLAGEGQGEGVNGGFIETSAAKVSIADNAVITTYAPYGKTGTWLIDPTDYNIASSGGDITGSQLSTNLGSSNITILSSSGATGTNGDVNVNDAVSWSADTTLTLSAYRNVNVNSNVTATGNTAGLVLTPSNTGAGGSYYLNNGAVITLSGTTPSLTIAGNPYTVINEANGGGAIALQDMSNNLAGYYALGSNIDATATSGWNSGAGFAPVGTFTGAFDGLGHTITGLFINRPGTNYIGLFRATDGATISNVGLVAGSVSGGGYYVGGLVGWNNGTITNSYNTSSVSGMYYVGGLAGVNEGAITNSYSTGAVSGTGGVSGSCVGGLAGLNWSGSTITNSYSTGSVSGRDYVGGLVGENRGAITDSYSGGSVSGTGNSVGGLAGMNDSDGAITDSYSTGAVTGTGGYRYVGGLAGWNSGTITNSYSGGSVGTGNYVGGLAGMNWNGTITNSYSGGSVSGTGDYVGGLVGWNGNNGRGNGTITNSYSAGSVSGISYVGGLVGWNDDAITDSYSTGAVIGNRYVGGLAGWNNGTITNSYSTGAVRGYKAVGGLAGTNDNDGTITNSYSTGSVTGVGSEWYHYVGGLAGDNYGTITNSYSTGSVSGTGNYVGGLVGGNYGTITNSYWDTQTSGWPAGPSGTGKTTAEMKQQESFTGWDFTNTWRIYEGYTYPLLKSFLTPLTITADNVTKTYDGTAWSAALQNVNYSGADTSKIFNRDTPYGSGSGKDVGSYTPQLYSIQQGYDITYVDGALTVNPAALTLASLTADNKTYDGSTTASISSYGALTGVVIGDTVILNSSSASSAFDTKNVGTGKTVTTSGLALDNANYSIANQTTTANVTPAALTATVAAPDKVYDGNTAAAPTLTITGGLVSGEVVTATGTATFNTKDVSTANLVTVNSTTLADGTGLASNYSLTTGETVTAYINPAALTITADDKSKVYGDVNPALTASYSGLKGTDTSSVVSGLTLNTAATTGSNAGAYTITAADGTAGNYTITFANGALTVNPAALTITADDKSKVYGDVNPALTASYSGLKGTDTSSVVSGLTLNTAATTGSNAGAYTITAADGTAGNYTITYNNGALTISVFNILDMYQIIDTENITDIKNFNDMIASAGTPDAELFTAKAVNYEIEQSVFGYQPPEDEDKIRKAKDKKKSKR